MLGSRGPGFVSVIRPSPCRIPGGRPEEQVGCEEAREGPGMIVSGAQVGDVLVGDAEVRVGMTQRCASE